MSTIKSKVFSDMLVEYFAKGQYSHRSRLRGI